MLTQGNDTIEEVSPLLKMHGSILPCRTNQNVPKMVFSHLSRKVSHLSRVTFKMMPNVDQGQSDKLTL